MLVMGSYSTLHRARVVLPVFGKRFLSSVPVSPKSVKPVCLPELDVLLVTGIPLKGCPCSSVSHTSLPFCLPMDERANKPTPKVRSFRLLSPKGVLRSVL